MQPAERVSSEAELHNLHSRVLVLAPTQRDAVVTRALFDQAEVPADICADASALHRELERGAGALLLTEEALATSALERVLAALRNQPAWSDVPVVMLMRGGLQSVATGRVLQALSNVTLLERPAPMRSVVSAVKAALRARQRQYEIRDNLAEIERTQTALRTSDRLYRAIGESIDYGVWMCDADGRAVYMSPSFLRLVGKSQEQCRNFGWLTALDPDEAQATLTAWRECVAGGRHWNREYRLRATDGQWHPVLARGVPVRDDAGAIVLWAGIHLDISDLKGKEAALREADRRKDDFLATLAHELRNPLAPIRLAARAFVSEQIDSEERRTSAAIIERQVRTMAALLDDLLDVSRITRGRLELKRMRVKLTSVIDAAVETARPLIEARRHAFSIALPENPPDIDVDPLRLSQVLANLLTNAAKYTDPGGVIELRVERREAQMVIFVRDSGIGLSPDALTRVFEMFSQVDAVIDRSQGGLGIGLALVKGLVELHGGRVHAHSDGLGRGAEFCVYLPQIVAAEAEAARSGDSEPRHVSEPVQTVLVADDNRDAVETLATLLRLAGHHVIEAHSGTEALEQSRKLHPRVMVLDIGMPGLNGYDVASQVRREPWSHEATLIAVTGWGRLDDRQRALTAGFDYHLTKPIDPDSLIALFPRE
jgi:PAS domain S-box-containing protein